ncbi:hypothetical protein BJ912DRAFT_1080095 [Pholiota molesta]|nr:hypothetical protein BJ912DRAFT_1080095 [Pholiota molesta]
MHHSSASNPNLAFVACANHTYTTQPRVESRPPDPPPALQDEDLVPPKIREAPADAPRGQGAPPMGAISTATAAGKEDIAKDIDGFRSHSLRRYILSAAFLSFAMADECLFVFVFSPRATAANARGPRSDHNLLAARAVDDTTPSPPSLQLPTSSPTYVSFSPRMVLHVDGDATRRTASILISISYNPSFLASTRIRWERHLLTDARPGTEAPSADARWAR